MCTHTMRTHTHNVPGGVDNTIMIVYKSEHLVSEEMPNEWDL